MPSGLSNVIRTPDRKKGSLGSLGENLAQKDAMTQQELENARMVLSGKVVDLRDAQPTSPTSVRVVWQLQVSHSEKYLEVNNR